MQWEILVAVLVFIGISMVIKGALDNRSAIKKPTKNAIKVKRFHKDPFKDKKMNKVKNTGKKRE